MKMKIDSDEFRQWVKEQEDKAWKEEMEVEYESWLENEDYHGRLKINE